MKAAGKLIVKRKAWLLPFMAAAVFAFPAYAAPNEDDLLSIEAAEAEAAEIEAFGPEAAGAAQLGLEEPAAATIQSPSEAQEELRDFKEQAVVGDGVESKADNIKPPNEENPKTTKLTPYPYPGPVIQIGEDIPLCAAAKDPATYVKKKAYRYIVHGKDGWLFRTVDFKHDFSARDQSANYFRMLNNALAEKGQQFMVIVQPSRGFMSPEHIDPADMPKDYNADVAKESFLDFIEQMNDWGIPVPDLTSPPDDLKYFRSSDLHWTLDGAKWSAEVVADTIKDMRVYGDLEKKEFVTEKLPQGITRRGVYYEFLQKICQVNLARETLPLWATAEVGSGAEDDLFGDATIPSTVLLGTSNSALAEYNFTGWLKENLKTDVQNASIAGGGFGSSALRYFASDGYIQNPPKLVIWEFLAQHNYNASDSMDDFRQIIPAVWGNCGKDKALATFSSGITKTETDLDTFMKAPMHNAYLYLEATNPNERTLQLEILYANGEGTITNLSRDKKIENNGKYFYLLDAAKGADPLYIRLITDTLEGQYEAALCPAPESGRT
jgi:alginate biosynthesis protein AlgX